MNDTTKRVAPQAILDLIQPAVAAVVNMTARATVGDSLPNGSHLSSRPVRSARVRFSGDNPHYHLGHFVWISVDRTTVQGTHAYFVDSEAVVHPVVEESTTEEPGLYARTNDIDLMVGIPPTYQGATPLRYADGLVDHIRAYLADNLRNLGRAELLLQIDCEDGSGPINLVTDSEAGWQSLREQGTLLTD